MSAEPRRDARWWIAAAVVAAVAVGIALAYVFSRSESAGDVVVQAPPSATPIATPGPSESPPPTEEPTPTETATAGEEPTASEEPSPLPGPDECGDGSACAAEPTDAAVAAFAKAHGPAQERARGDVDGDGVDEAVVAAVQNNAVRIVVGRWNGESFRRAFSDDGGPAQRLVSLRVEDFNGKPGAEIVTEQAAGTEGRSLSVWGDRGGEIDRQVARGGCWDGFHTYGISGATIESGAITATCDGSPQPPESWTSDVYEWRTGRWAYARTVEPGD